MEPAGNGEQAMIYPQVGDRIAYSQHHRDDYLRAVGPEFAGRRPNRGTVMEAVHVGPGSVKVWWDGQTQPYWIDGAGCMLTAGDLVVIGGSDPEWVGELRAAEAALAPWTGLG